MTAPKSALPPAQDGVTRIVLKNGLTLLIEPMHHAPVVALQAWVHVGGADENKAHEAGLAHLHEHMLFKGTDRRAVGEVARCVEAAGGEINAWTSFDETVYHLVMGKDEAALGLDLLADVLQHSTFDAGELKKEIEVVLEEIRRAQDNPGRRHSMALFASAFAVHPYRHQVLGTAQSVAETTQKDMVAFFKGHYRPDNTTLIVCGDILVDDVVREAERLFGAWQPAQSGSAAARKAPRTPEPPLTGLRAQVLAEDVQEARLTLAWHSLPAQHADTPALDLFSVMLGHGDTSRLHRVMVRPRAVQDAYASNYTPKDTGLMLLGATLEDSRPEGEAVCHVVRQLVAEATRMASGDFSQDELATARTLVLAEEAFSRQTMEGQARKRGFFVSTADDYLYERVHTAAIREVTREAIMEVAQRILAAWPTVVLQLPKEAPASARDLTTPDFEKALAAGRQTGAPKARAQRPRAANDLGVTRIAIPQGPVLLVQQEPSGVTAMRAVAQGGLRWETPHHGGLGLLMASAWGQATQQHDALQLAGKVARMGGSMAAFCGRNTVGLSADWLSEHQDAGLSLFLQALWQPRFAPEDVLRERHGIAERLRAREDNPGGVAMDLFLRTLYPQHPYGYLALGSEASLMRLTDVEVAQYHAAHVTPERLVLSIVGPMDPDAVAEQVLRSIENGHFPHAVAAHKDLVADAPPQGPQKKGRPLAKQQAHVIIGSMGTTFAAPNKYSLDVMSAVLNGQSGRLFMDLRDEQSLAYSLSCSSSEGIEPGHVMVHMACGFDKVQRACKGVREHLQRMIDTPVSPSELQRAKQMLIGAHGIDLQRPGARAMTYATQDIYGLGYDAHVHDAEKIRAVTASDVQKVASELLHANRLIQVVVGPGDDAGAA
jgi:zinc protease